MTERLLAGAYRLEENLDDEGTLEVWRAVDQRRRRTVVVRIPKVGCADDWSRVFAAETDVASRLRDRCLARALSSGVDDGIAFLVSEFAEGRSLEELLANGERLPQRSARIVADLCRLLARARRANVAHVALQPGHLVVGAGGVKVIRFAAVADGGRLGLEATRFTAPEQDTAEVATEAEEVYNLGAILRALIGTTSESATSREGDALPAIARKATAAAPSERYATIAEMLDALRAYRERSGVQRHVRPAAALAAVAVAIGILVTWFLGTTVTVPRVVGMPLPAAAASLRRAMLVPATATSGAAAVRVQYPVAGSRVRPRTAVRILVQPPTPR